MSARPPSDPSHTPATPEAENNHGARANTPPSSTPSSTPDTTSGTTSGTNPTDTPRSWQAFAPAGIAIAIVLAGGIWGGWRVWQQRQRTLQCQQTIEVVDRGYVRILEFQGSDPQTIETLANSLQAVADELRLLELSDPRLAEQQTQFVSAYRELGDAYGKMADEVRRISRAKPNPEQLKELKRSQAKVKRYGADAYERARRLETLSLEFNQYCGVNR